MHSCGLTAQMSDAQATKATLISTRLSHGSSYINTIFPDKEPFHRVQLKSSVAIKQLISRTRDFDLDHSKLTQPDTICTVSKYI